MNTNQFRENLFEIVDSNQDLALLGAKCLNIQPAFEFLPHNDEDLETIHPFEEHQLRHMRGTIIEYERERSNNSQIVIHKGNFYPYEFTQNQLEECRKKMQELNHSFQQLVPSYSFEGKSGHVIRIFYHKRWYISTYHKLDAKRVRVQTKSLQKVFESALLKDYNLTLEQLLLFLNTKYIYNFLLLMEPKYVLVNFLEYNDNLKKIYFIQATEGGSLTSDEGIDNGCNMERLPKPTFDTLESVFAYVKDMRYPFIIDGFGLIHQGLVLRHSDGTKYRIISDNFAGLSKP
jgi:hypothetical protein